MASYTGYYNLKYRGNMSVIKIKKIDKKEIKNLKIKQETLQKFWQNNLIPIPGENDDNFIINTVESTLLGKIFNRNIFSNKFNMKFTKYFTKLSPALDIILVHGKMTIDVFTSNDKELILSSVAPLFDDIQGLTIEIVQHFEDSNKVGTEVGE